jgi:two-component system response regulator DevR
MSKLLLIDDEADVQYSFRRIFDSPEIELFTASSGEEGLQLIPKLKPDLVLMDIRLPDGSGIDACRQILAVRPGTRVLVLSSMVTDSLVQDAIAAGAHGYLLKDIDGQGLVSAIIDVAAGKSILDPAVTRRVLQLMKSGQNLTAGSTTRHAIACCASRS